MSERQSADFHDATKLARWIASRPAANEPGTLNLARAYLELLAENERLRENVETCESYASGLEDEIEDLQGREGGK